VIPNFMTSRKKPRAPAAAGTKGAKWVLRETNAMLDFLLELPENERPNRQAGIPPWEKVSTFLKSKGT
jgi:hypothetical protein